MAVYVLIRRAKSVAIQEIRKMKIENTSDDIGEDLLMSLNPEFNDKYNNLYLL